ncbi:DUF2690 domain-containing protein [Streptomyces rubrogriseus]|uniref:DUF2690 domain-containing protein n=1 Tax=Streptomyces rubrogriseus TaxID=194673 RepID=UPI001EF1A091|nr:DUF2690 domain-containing protein [Streptomyces rubrogriseus]
MPPRPAVRLQHEDHDQFGCAGPPPTRHPRLSPLGQVNPTPRSGAQATLCGDHHPALVDTAYALAITYRVNLNATRCASPQRTKGVSLATHRIPRFLAGTLAVLAPGVAVPAEAFVAAAEPACKGASCNGKNPNATGCAKDAVTPAGAVARSAGGGPAVQMRYSKKCNAVWARFESAANSNWRGKLEVSLRRQPGRAEPAVARLVPPDAGRGGGDGPLDRHGNSRNCPAWSGCKTVTVRPNLSRSPLRREHCSRFRRSPS